MPIGKAATASVYPRRADGLSISVESTALIRWNADDLADEADRAKARLRKRGASLWRTAAAGH
jgi:hypothetical protein